jgi:DNA repair photolyase
VADPRHHSIPPIPRKGRGALGNPAGRFEIARSVAEDDGWSQPGAIAEGIGPAAPLATEVYVDASRTIITRNRSPDVPFDRSINPYKGCEHGCVYCFARPTHAYLDLSPGLDFETKIFHKPHAAALLVEALARPDYACQAIAMGTNTDPYQPIERHLKVTRQILEVLASCRHPVSIVTKGGLLERDLDLLAGMARDGLASVMISITTLDADLKRTLEPRAAAPSVRLKLVRALRDAGIPVGVMVAPVIPGINDDEIETIVAASAAAGAQNLGWVLLRLPHEVEGIFQTWLDVHVPDKAARVMNLMRQLSGGRPYNAAFGRRQRGAGPFADLLEQRFRTARRRAGLADRGAAPLRTDLFVPPHPAGQMRLL